MFMNDSLFVPIYSEIEHDEEYHEGFSLCVIQFTVK